MVVSHRSLPVRFAILGPLEVSVDGVRLSLGGAKQRGLLALLLTEPNHVVSVGRIVEALWGLDAPERASSTLQVHISNLRKALGPATEALGVDEIVRTQRPGYVVNLTSAELDLLDFREHVATAQQQAARGNAAAASEGFAQALELVRGEPLADLLDEPFAPPIATHLRQLVARTHEARFETELLVGRHREILPEIDRAVDDDPLNEHMRALQMVALYRCGRQADALAVYRDARELLVEQLGVDPSPELRELEGRVLAQDPALDAPASPGPKVEMQTVLRSSVLVPLAVVVLDSDDAQFVPLTRPINSIGRREGNDIVLDDPQVSRLHAEIRVEGGHFVLVDCQSTNGLRVNGTRVERRVLESGDEIRIGDHTLRFRLEDR
jgi:DNA-binding SARP family transcriptional activator